MYRALDHLIKVAPPKVRGREPFWRPTPAAPWKDVREPAWNFRADLTEKTPLHGPATAQTRIWGLPHHQYGILLEGDTVVTLDTNAAYLAAASSVDVAHGKLSRTKKIPFSSKLPGYWLIDVHPWTVQHIWSPLGTATLPTRAWLTTPTVTLLAQLSEAGYWPGVTVHDSWTCPTRTRLRAWTDLVADHRRAALSIGDTERYDEIKTGYSQAVTLMQMTHRSPCFRPDWSAHIRTQHAATMWRKAWQSWAQGCPVLASGTTDEISVPIEALRPMTLDLDRESPIRLDESGATLGTFKVKTATLVTDWVRPEECAR